MKESDRKLLRFLAIYEIAGGILGITWLVIYFPHHFPLGTLLILGFGAVLYFISIVAGIYLWKENLFLGKRLSIVIQGFQMIIFAIGGIEYLFISGMKLSIVFDFTHSLRINFDWALSQIDFFYTNSSLIDNSLIGINIVPIIFVFVLEKLVNRIEEQKKIQDEIKLMQKSIS